MLYLSCLSAHSSVRMQQLGSHWDDCHEIRFLYIFRKTVEKIRVSLKYDKNSGTLNGYRYTVLSYLAQIVLELNIFQAKVVGKKRKIFYVQLCFFLKSYRI